MWAVAVPSGCGKRLCPMAVAEAVGMVCPDLAGCGKRLCLEVAGPGHGCGLWHNFSLGNAYPMICKRFANTELMLIQGFVIPNRPHLRSPTCYRSNGN
jgi:hypothetical protein